MDIPLPRALIEGWQRRAGEPFVGITHDGVPIRGLYSLQEEGAPIASMVAAADGLLRTLGASDRAKILFAIDAPQWQLWSNPEFLVYDFGLRLEDMDDSVRHAAMAVLESSLSAAGFDKARACMRTNAFLGELLDLPLLMNEWSYNFLLFGVPSPNGPWGWSLYGHHLCLNCFVRQGQMVISPVFMGAEPNEVDEGPLAGLKLFSEQEAGGLALMRSLSPELRRRSTIYERMVDPAMPPGRLTPGDERHLGGAFHDNRVVPYEGVPATEFEAVQRDALMDLVTAFLDYLAPGPLHARLQHIAEHLDQTWWSWIGGHEEGDTFYYRIQSPVVMLEFDHHPGIWLTNEEPDRCHIHTVVRTPNGNDYGRDLLREHYEIAHGGAAPGR